MSMAPIASSNVRRLKCFLEIVRMGAAGVIIIDAGLAGRKARSE